jgi:hypothetical protein
MQIAVLPYLSDDVGICFLPHCLRILWAPVFKHGETQASVSSAARSLRYT